MRRIRKAPPPRNVSHASQESRTFIEAENELLQNLAGIVDQVAFARSCYDALDKKKLREVMFKDQGGLCIFCEGRVKEGKRAPRIDHWQPLSHYPESALNWRNLYLSCDCPFTCDCRKKNIPLRSDEHQEELPLPADFDYQRCLGFTSKGEIYVHPDAPLNDGQRKALAQAIGVVHGGSVQDNGVLNLNHPALVEARAAAIDGQKLKLEKKYQGRTATRMERKNEAEALLNREKLDEYVSIRVRWLEKSLGEPE